jgi:hypothetical protein
MHQEIDAVERHLREQAATKAVKDADTYGWAEVRQGVFLDTSDRLKAAGQTAEGAPYFLSTNDGEPPQAISGARDEKLRAMVDVERDLNKAALAMDLRDERVRRAGRAM